MHVYASLNAHTVHSPLSFLSSLLTVNPKSLWWGRKRYLSQTIDGVGGASGRGWPCGVARHKQFSRLSASVSYFLPPDLPFAKTHKPRFLYWRGVCLKGCAELHPEKGITLLGLCLKYWCLKFLNTCVLYGWGAYSLFFRQHHTPTWLVQVATYCLHCCDLHNLPVEKRSKVVLVLLLL